ncbi:MAG TPA: TIGR03936 family radical SAM-associated protein [Anaerohalosphaeraceae bacterium]|nr:TIGR03936 family radical SAM-associated protein [Phycisphaerae bacterium]HOK94695.1 TIGR03936 family radical SAM-associated protein [Anaerohalosphaeraceae bacterium]HOL32321.1 TIGR03936 family radical SAM-associated protein [Anaerohalosphaeraceae bacterium]HOM75103.1 TIGR03936 family radical SAM-associated protein [Anaerohalosphaeraceae bacterium]HPC63142.1 TIGR03936 family radical SAM-associated protein [Anaerohalosphaeraceae bacterium]
MSEQVYTLIADFSITGNAAYLSHQETLTLFERAMIRAEVPLIFSSGFNPRPHLSIPLPRSVGVQSAAERLCAAVRFSKGIIPQDLSGGIQRQLPVGCTIRQIQCREGKITFQPRSVRYAFFVEPPAETALMQHCQQCRQSIQDKRPIEVQRLNAKTGHFVKLDISPFVEKMDIFADRIELVCRVSPAGTVRVDEMMQWLHLDQPMLREPVLRMEVQWEQN